MLVTVKEYAEIHGLNINTVASALRSGRLTVAKLEKHRRYVDSDEKISTNNKKRVSCDPAYRTWQGMKKRCENPNCDGYRWYGQKGVKVCDEWHDSRVFIEWMYANGWEPGLTIDRIDSNGDYCPENCRIITKSENSKRANRERVLAEYSIGTVNTIEDLLSGNAAALSRLTEYPHSTILRWQHKPTSIPLDAAIKIANDIDLSAEEWANIYRNTLKSAPRSAGS